MASASSARDSSARVALRLDFATIGWNIVEAAVSVAGGLAAASVALVAFGLDSVIEVVSATVVLVYLRTLLSGHEPDEHRARRSLRIIAVTFFALACYVTVDAAVTLVTGERPAASALGIAITSISVVLMPALAWGKRHTSDRLAHHGLRAPAVLLRADAAETLLCAALSLTTLIGLAANATLGWWWADPLAGLVVVFFALREGREAWVGELLESD